MGNITSLAIDLAKNVFQLHGTDKKGKAILKKKIAREKLLEVVAKLPRCNLFMEACGSANYWGRKFQGCGHQVRLINPIYVKPYVKRNKNDINDAAAIAAAARDPDMRFCEVKNEAQQDMQSLHRARSLSMQNRTATVNQIRGILLEYGIAIPQGTNSVRKKLVAIFVDDSIILSEKAKFAMLKLQKRLAFFDEEISDYDEQVKTLCKNNESCQRLIGIPGVGELGATILASFLGNGALFKNGRHFAAFLGLVPKQHSSGGKNRLLGISKGGDTYVRTLLIHGARAVLRYIEHKDDWRSMWAKSLVQRRGKNISAVALANKMARIAWALSYYQTEYNVMIKSSSVPVVPGYLET